MADKTLYVWDADSGQPSGILLHDNGDGTFSLAVSGGTGDGAGAAEVAPAEDAVFQVTPAEGAEFEVLSEVLGAPADEAVYGDDDASINARLRALMVLIDDAGLPVQPATAETVFPVSVDHTTPGESDRVIPRVLAAAPAEYRTWVVAADVMALPGVITCTKIAGAGLSANTYYVKILAVNQYGRTTAVAGNATVQTESTNLRINAAFAQVAGATHYDIYCSTAADALWSGRITEAQRAVGVLLSTKGAGSAGDSVDVDVVGSGLAASAAAANFAAVIPATPVDCSGYNYCDFLIKCSRTGDAVAPALIWAPYFLNSLDSVFAQGESKIMSFGGAAGVYNAMVQRYRVDVRGNSGVAFVVQAIAGTGMSVDVAVQLS